MAQLRQDYLRFTERDTEVIAIGPENADAFAEWWHKENMPFIGIADPKHLIANMYGQQVNPLKLGRMPALMVIDKKGNIRLRHYGDSMSDIPTDEDVLSTIDIINREDRVNV